MVTLYVGRVVYLCTSLSINILMDILFQPWSWYVAGPILALIMFALIFFGENFGMSNNLRTMCAIGGGDKLSDFFKINTKEQYWNLAFVLGSILGGFIAVQFMTGDTAIHLSEGTVATLEGYGFKNVGADYLPEEIFGMERLKSFTGILMLLGGGILVGFGTRYAGGCTSGHAISGLSNLQVPSLIAVIGFFIGGLVMVHLIMPFIF